VNGPIEEYLDEVSKGIGEVDAKVLREALAEIRGHLAESAAGYVELGFEEGEAERLAVLDFGTRRVAEAAVPVKRDQLLDFRIFPLSSWWWVSAILMMLVFDNILGFGWLVLVVAIGLVVRGFMRRRLEIGNGIFVSLTVPIAVILMSSAFFTVDRTGSTISRSAATVEANRLRIEADRNFAKQSYETEVMKKFQDGMGREFLVSLPEVKSKGYLLPTQENAINPLEKRYSRSLEEATRKWAIASKGVDLEGRQKWIDYGRTTQIMLANEPLEKSYLSVVVARFNIVGTVINLVIPIVLFSNACGLLLRLFFDLIVKWLRANRGTINQ